MKDYHRYNDHKVRKGTTHGNKNLNTHLLRLQFYLSKREKLKYPKTKTITNVFGLTLDAKPQNPRPRLFNLSVLGNSKQKDVISKRIDSVKSNHGQSHLLRSSSRTPCLMCDHIDHHPTRKKEDGDVLSNSIEKDQGYREEIEGNAIIRENFRKQSQHEVQASCFLTEYYESNEK